MTAIIKTSKGFINIEGIDRITPPNQEDRIFIEMAGSDASYGFDGEEAARIVRYFNLMTLLDTTIRDDDPDPALAEYQHIKAQQRTADYSDQCSSDLPF